MTLAMNGVIHEWVDLAGKSSHVHDSNQGKSFQLCLRSECRLRSLKSTWMADRADQPSGKFGSNQYQLASINTDRRRLFLRIG